MSRAVVDLVELKPVRRALYALDDRTWYGVGAKGGNVVVRYKDGPSRRDVAEVVRALLGPVEVTVVRALSVGVLLDAECLFQLITGDPGFRVVDACGRIRDGAPARIEGHWVGRRFEGAPSEVLEELADVFVLKR